ncbi:hypothetical protein [Methanosarcina barkeri]|nr:hypothetical protein [Methanosarcina barkeri]
MQDRCPDYIDYESEENHIKFRGLTSRGKNLELEIHLLRNLDLVVLK